MSTTKDYLHLHFIVLVWGFTAILGKLISIPAVELVFYRTLIASFALLGLLLVKGIGIRVGWKTLAYLIGTGFIIGAHWVSFFAAGKVSTASVSLIGMATCTFWTSLLEPLILKRKLQLYEIVLGLVILVGLYIVVQVEFEYIYGIGLGVLAAILAALFSVINAKLIQKQNPYVISFYEMTGACLATVLFFPVYKESFTANGMLDLTLKGLDWLYILVLALICTVYAFSASVELMKRIKVYAMNLTINLEPIYGMVLAVLILGSEEKMDTGFYLGSSIIVVAVLSYPFLNRVIGKKHNATDTLR